VNLNWIDVNEVGPCIPTTCLAEGAECGTIPDGCGDYLDCGACGTDEVCNIFYQCEAEPVCGDGAFNGDETCSTCETDCGPCEFCGDGVCYNEETCETCEADCGSCGGGCTCPLGCNNVVNASVQLVVNGTNNTCYFFNSLGSYINSWNSAKVDINGVDITNAYMGSWSYPGEIDGGYFIYHRSTVAWGHLEVK